MVGYHMLVSAALLVEVAFVHVVLRSPVEAARNWEKVHMLTMPQVEAVVLDFQSWYRLLV
jgi:hypothetical protein